MKRVVAGGWGDRPHTILLPALPLLKMATLGMGLSWLVSACGIPPEEMAKALHEASSHGDISQVKYVLEKNPDLAKHRDRNGNTPLHQAANIEVAQALIDKGADVNSSNNQHETPLHRAQSGKIVELLISKGADLRAVDASDLTPICTAANGEVAAALFKAGASLESLSPSASSSYRTPLYFAVLNNRPDLVKVLIDLGANRSILEDKASLLHIAAKNGFAAIAEILLDKGLAVDSTDGFQATPLHYAALNDHLEVAKTLLSHGANVNARLSPEVQLVSVSDIKAGPGYVGSSPASGATPLVLAKSSDMVQLLERHGAVR